MNQKEIDEKVPTSKNSYMAGVDEPELRLKSHPKKTEEKIEPKTGIN